MSAVTRNLPSAQPASLAQVERSHASQVRDEGRANPQASLYRGRTTFTYSRQTSAKKLADKQHASSLHARLAQKRPARAGEQARFAAPRKAVAQSLRQAGSQAAAQRAGAGRLAGLRVSRDGGRGGNRGGGQQSSQQDGQKQQQGQQQQRRERDPLRDKGDRRIVAGTASVFPLSGNSAAAHTVWPDWLAGAVAHEAGAARWHAIGEAACDALLALRDKLAATPAGRRFAGFDAQLYQLAHDVTLARAGLDAPAAPDFETLRARLVERAAQRDATGAPPPAESTRTRHFNLLLGLQLLMLERPLLASRMGRTRGTLASLAAGASPAGDMPDTPTDGAGGTASAQR
ncbi:hypothetical protein [Burkholderia sp. BCC1998]|uniref:hypothetical protein n=1 Tax=Burkholderia sp. BCC1998 TaxID=2817447 RepID=UPI002AB75F84|nr:hypothetical protein [Burkholderia sp. BCC1998]